MPCVHYMPNCPAVSSRRPGWHRIEDPDLLLWVHCTEVESFLSTYRRTAGCLAPGEADHYVREMREWPAW